ncbi:hypothetical protein GCM10011512_02180 [Tersicoccus solisilvae]|uniref:Uncharacterized protein n=1 Tax=Tersicoccus solisilvae TaxID=1882339 RepID=A0ABQ1NKH9_9MICC|nr:hypothetical protein [Tersicoccus solisilvae]GGC79096.1 hypothetical protein GCM10011512_02180 [Tersicoccus solisilvae]
MSPSRDQRRDRPGTIEPRPLIRYAHTPSLVAANGLTAAPDDGRDRATTAPTRPHGTRHRPRPLWRRLGAAALLTATLATGSALPAQAAAADATRPSAAATVVEQQHATLTTPVQLTRSTASLPPRKGRG